mmetsp:Transcript_25474/g.79401  ORF Transcript_25474/g.79401 Transcript_25474/m.79401 type:complete len:268 (-) Transcript_25474:272-1075(-)
MPSNSVHASWGDTTSGQGTAPTSGEAGHDIMRESEPAGERAATSALGLSLGLLDSAAASLRSCFKPFGPWSRVATFVSTQPASRRSSTSRSRHRMRVGTSGLNVKPRISQNMTLSWSWYSQASLSSVGPATVRSVARASSFSGTTGVCRRSSAIMKSSLAGTRPRTRISPIKRRFPMAAFLRKACASTSASWSASSTPLPIANGNHDASKSCRHWNRIAARKAIPPGPSLLQLLRSASSRAQRSAYIAVKLCCTVAFLKISCAKTSM